MAEKAELYPPIEPFAQGMLEVTDLHSMYWEVSGNPAGVPICVLHGGPGSGSKPFYRRFYDPKAYKIILFDQRGAGKSTPFCELKENTTFDLVDDMEKLRKHLGVVKWVVVGGSWGSTLALAYACCHADRVSAIVTFGIFTCSKSEIDWTFGGGAEQVFPEFWEEFVAQIPVEERHDLMQAYHKRIFGDDEQVSKDCTRAWARWECAIENFEVDRAHIEECDDDWAVSRAKIECHYFVNCGFFASRWHGDQALLDQIHNMQDIPGVIVQSRYDMVCPIRTAWELHKKWPAAELIVVPDSGHSPRHPHVTAEVLKAIDKFKHINEEQLVSQS